MNSVVVTPKKKTKKAKDTDLKDTSGSQRYKRILLLERWEVPISIYNVMHIHTNTLWLRELSTLKQLRFACANTHNLTKQRNTLWEALTLMDFNVSRGHQSIYGHKTYMFSTIQKSHSDGSWGKINSPLSVLVCFSVVMVHGFCGVIWIVSKAIVRQARQTRTFRYPVNSIRFECQNKMGTDQH